MNDFTFKVIEVLIKHAMIGLVTLEDHTFWVWELKA